MADEADKQDDELLLTDETEEEADAVADGTASETDEQDETDEEEEVLSFGDDLTEGKPDDSNTIKLLRERLKQVQKEAREAKQSAPKPEPVELGPKPTLADHDYDEEKFEAALDAWKQRKADAEKQTAASTEQQQREAEAWQGEIKRYKDDLGSLGYADAQSAEETVVAALTDVQQAILVKVADRPGRLLYALAKNPERLAELAAVTDPLKFAGQIARQEGQLKVIKKRKAIEPEKIERGTGATVQTADKQLAKLEKEAERTGDRSKLIAYKKAQKAKA